MCAAKTLFKQRGSQVKNTLPCIYFPKADSTDSLRQEKMQNPDEEQLGSIENPIRFKNQVFRTLLDECLKSASLFSDATFPADQNSVGTPEDPDPKNAITWLRPKVGVPGGPPLTQQGSSFELVTRPLYTLYYS